MMRTEHLTCAQCGGRVIAEAVAFHILVGRKQRGERAPQVRCRSCETMHLVELVDGRAIVSELARFEEVAP